MILNWSPAYFIARLIVISGIIGFYKKFQRNGEVNLPIGKPIIYAPNHQSAFMDPVLVATVRVKQIHFLVRADVFKKKTIKSIFKWLKMMPVYRQRDGKDSLEKNEEIFNNCYRILKHNQGLIMFPEGNQQNKKSLRGLKKGVSRVAFGAESKYDFSLDVQVIPVGVNYSHHTKMYSSCLINYGKPIAISDYKELYYENEGKAFNALKDKMQAEISKLIINISNKQYYDTIEECRLVCHKQLLKHAGLEKDDLTNEIAAGQHFIQKIEAWIPHNPEEAEKLKNNVASIKTKTESLKLKYHLFSADYYNNILSLLFLIVLAPIHLVGVLYNYLPFKLPEWLVKNKIKDDHFHSSIKMLGGSIIYFLYHMIVSNTILCVFGWEAGLACFIAMPFLGYFSLKYWVHFLKTTGKMRYNSMRKQKNSELMEILCLKSQISSTIDIIFSS
jgi:1-acyl-sn-glycerol-3-phosphate acyltransferase